MAFAFGWSGAPAQGSPPAAEPPGRRRWLPADAAPNRHGRRFPHSGRDRGGPGAARVRRLACRSPRPVAATDGMARVAVESCRFRVGHLPDWLLWMIVAWMLLALLAILAHLIYTLWRLWAARRGRRSPGPSRAVTGGTAGHPGLGFRDRLCRGPPPVGHRRLAGCDQISTTWRRSSGWIVRVRSPFGRRKPTGTISENCGPKAGFRARSAGLRSAFESIVYAGQAATASTSRDMADTVEGLLHEPARTAAN